MSGSTVKDGGARAGGRIRPWLRPVAWGVLALSTLVLVLAGCARATVVNRVFYQSVLDEQDAYERLYDEVLVDPATARVTRDLLGRLPVPEAQVTANLKNVLPPATLRTLVDEQIGHAVAYLRGKEPRLSVSVDVRPVLTNIGSFAEIYLGDLVASAQGRRAPDFAAFTRELTTALDDISRGRRPENLPELRLDEDAARQAADWLMEPVPEDRRAALRPQVEAALGTGDVASALADVGPYALGGRTSGAASDLSALTEDGHWNVVPDLEAAGVDLGAAKQARFFTKLTLGVVQGVALALALGSAAVLAFAGTASWAPRLRRIGTALAAGGALAAVVLALARWQVASLMVRPPPSWPPSVSRLLDDVQHGAADALLSVGLITSALPLLAGLVLVAAAWGYERLMARRAPRLSARRRGAVLGTAVGALLALAMAGVVLAPLAAGKDSRELCLGSESLCERRYDEVAYLATHNAMSTTADKFIGPLHDPDIVAQLDAGARALLIDTQTWETPAEVAERLRDADFPPDMKRQITRLVERANPPRPGLWLCHAVCRAGAIPLVETLRTLGTWLDAHPGEVVTLIVQDAVDGTRTRQAFRQAGLERLVFTPDADPGRPWPTLGDMVDSGRRLVVFAEQADGPAPWYRNFYRYGMETPFAFTAPKEMSCVPHRGGTGKRLFLLNHFITDMGGSRLDAAVVNKRDFILDRVRRCEQARGRPVNFVAVDFATIGDALGAVDTLNKRR
ncbi:PI-PLC domain-containing protein [Streptomyces sp. NPDC047123]|uniref:PI-PLC domain-containing protein n=1 Tax=Streptomyces sp. NPDC047123 TaxID=3155622 RepID=UPI0033E0BCD9